jgi:PPOX class probable F420-dependent enzyme
MSKLSDSMRELLNGRHYATLATLNEDGSIHLTPVWYLFEHEGFFVSTASSDRKVRNILARPEASLIIDIRKLGAERWVSASGTAGQPAAQDAGGTAHMLARQTAAVL